MYKGTVSEQMQRLLDEYTEEAIEASDKAIKGVADEAADKLRDTSPRRTKGKTAGDYAKGWAVTVLKKGKFKGIFARTGQYVVHNKTNYHLTHLLEYGHLIVNAKGTYGRTRPIEHIAPVEDWAADEVVSAIKKEI